MTLFMNLFGGIGLFLLGMHMMTEGLKTSAGQGLRTILAHSTKTRLRGVFSGMFITSLVQSSSAVTVATIGFVNAGLLTLAQALAITYGSNIGTTMTGWLVSTIGFHFKIQAFALPAIGIGMFMKLLSKQPRLAALGEAMAGFGIFFLGIDLLKNGFTGLEDTLPLSPASDLGVGGLLLFLGIGTLLTVLMQSSSAAIAIILTATGSGVMAVEAGAVMVIGANIGTTSTAVLAVIGATSNAKRMAMAHVLFNGITGFVALLLLPILLMILGSMQSQLQLESGPAVMLALFHTVFNVLGVLLLWPVTGRLVRFLEGRFRLAEEDEAKPKYLDSTTLQTPFLALRALTMELARIGRKVAALVEEVFSSEVSSAVRLGKERAVIEALIEAVGDFTTQLRQQNLPEHVSEVLSNAIGISRYYRDSVDFAIAASKLNLIRPTEKIAESAAHFKSEVVALIELANVESPEYSFEKCEQKLKQVVQHYQELKAQSLKVGTLGKMPVRQVVELIELLKDIQRMADHIVKASQALDEMRAIAEDKQSDAAENEELVEAKDDLIESAEAASSAEHDEDVVEGIRKG